MDGCYKLIYCVLTLLALSKITLSFHEDDHNVDIEEKINYKGDQVLRVKTVNSKQRKKVKELEDQKCM